MESCKLSVRRRRWETCDRAFISFEIKARIAARQGSIKDSRALRIVSMTGPKGLLKSAPGD
jgi:hypothetical protein